LTAFSNKPKLFFESFNHEMIEKAKPGSRPMIYPMPVALAGADVDGKP
jgi:hypothetical protein